ncbi:uncharacterized protein LOC143245387 isoform X2 [Tachypleus tridentatus]|uniref:uncharacterized protein LOC143245387 isoform X2 n=1 Tax=Tachypleus tridentatus TaxID=6853 RepID=UPI003FD31D5E
MEADSLKKERPAWSSTDLELGDHTNLITHRNDPKSLNIERDNALQIHPSLNFPASLSSLLREAINHQILLQARLRRRNQLKSNHTVHLLSQTSLRRVNWSQALKPNYLPSSDPKL